MWIDISYPLSQDLNVYPGDRNFSSNSENFGTTVVSSIESTLHLGTHTDAPSHFILHGKTIDQVDVNKYIGICQIITFDYAKQPSQIIWKRDLPELKARKILFATNSFNYYAPFDYNYASFSTELCEYLIQQGCELIGIDTPSVDPYEDNEFLNHKLFLSNEVAIIEGLKLNGIKAGLYEMLSIPLALSGLEASPLRVLIKPIKKENT